GLAVPTPAILADGAGPAADRADSPRGTPAHLLASGLGFIGEVAVAELGVLPVGVEQGVGAVCLGEFGIGDRVLEPSVVGLTSNLKYPPAPPRRGSRQRRARTRAGTTFSRQIRLGQVGSSA